MLDYEESLILYWMTLVIFLLYYIFRLKMPPPESPDRVSIIACSFLVDQLKVKVDGKTLENKVESG